MSNFCLNLLILASQSINVAFFNGSPYEMLSSRAWRRSPASARWQTYQTIINALFFWQRDHCKETHEAEVKRIQLELETRKS